MPIFWKGIILSFLFSFIYFSIFFIYIFFVSLLTHYNSFVQNIEKVPEEYEAIADQFGALPMYFLRFFGSTQVID